ncbi:MAG TPA: hypothetical protein VER12_16730 [Polyangiaceae bacterium]|nr:hypothetical protein [Polyangiaceae bacterium]
MPPRPKALDVRARRSSDPGFRSSVSGSTKRCTDGQSVPQLDAGKKRLAGNPGFMLVCDGREVTTISPLERVDDLVFSPDRLRVPSRAASVL